MVLSLGLNSLPWSCVGTAFNSPLEHQFFNFPFSQSHPSVVTKPSSLKLATSGITHPSDVQKGESQVIQGLSLADKIIHW